MWCIFLNHRTAAAAAAVIVIHNLLVDDEDLAWCEAKQTISDRIALAKIHRRTFAVRNAVLREGDGPSLFTERIFQEFIIPRLF